MSNSNFTNMAVVQRGSITIGIATGGASPALAAHLKTQIEAAVGEEYAQLARWLAELRSVVGSRLLTQAEREAFWQRVINSRILEHLRQGDEAQARAEFDQLWADAEQEI
jgi:siroheme synthase-like protein